MSEKIILGEDHPTINKIIKLLDENKNVFLTGPAGVGKSTIITNLISILRGRGLNVAATATTGVASINIDGITINKLLGFNIQTNMKCIPFLKSRGFIWAAKAKVIQRLDIIIIDEVSMLSSDQFDLIDAILKEYRKNNFPFGNVKMVFVGDFLQLPAVTRILKPWAFQADAWKNGNIENISLTKVIRQIDHNLISALHFIRKGITNESTNWLFNQTSKKRDKATKEQIPNLVSLNNEADLINNNSLDKIRTEPHTYKAKIKGTTKGYKEQIINSVVAKKELIIKPNARVMAIYNDPKNLYINGSVGTVQECTDKYVLVKFDNGNLVKIIRQIWLIKSPNDMILARFRQIPLILAYAITIHKSQGSTLDSLYVDCTNIFSCGQLYTALSRCTNLNGLYTKNISDKCIITDPIALEFTNNIEEKKPA